MNLDQRQCPVSKKAPPQGKEWRHYGEHVRKCSIAFYDREREKASDGSVSSIADRLRKIMSEFE